ncbi:hypothetical protein [Fimbriimonas ginsengisoli]|uniref:Uncharacterized protein n=1 Tax=Fimbriimonas ginsengisoli Gsoil 348 TaxID=661478 RepID=A0A068NTW2_FIMGI|nr:hypothetical protein [Fimbriimonas ginsengisoli]AIE86200.1 hypothetical protein OP10G_2832 [Fimbriimonas ginsengisoli Gsoil 348]
MNGLNPESIQSIRLRVGWSAAALVIGSVALVAALGGFGSRISALRSEAAALYLDVDKLQATKIGLEKDIVARKAQYQETVSALKPLAVAGVAKIHEEATADVTKNNVPHAELSHKVVDATENFIAKNKAGAVPRVYIQAFRDDPDAVESANKLMAKLNGGASPTGIAILAPGVERVDRLHTPKGISEIRYKPGDNQQEVLDLLQAALQELGYQSKAKKLSPADARRARPDHYEVWLGLQKSPP